MGQQAPTRDLGPCALEFGGVSLGETVGGCAFRFSQSVTPVKEDRYGESPIDEIYIGDSCELEANLTRQSLAQIAAALPGASGSGTAGNQMVVRNIVGRSAYDNALTLVVKPIVEGVDGTDTTEYLTIFKASPRPDYDVPYSVDGQRVYKTIFRGFRVQTDATGMKAGWLWKIGSA